MGYKKGDLVSIFSLQSFFYGGFLYDEPAIVRQDQIDNNSVLVMLVRNYNGSYKMDYGYEIYPEQIRMINCFDNFDLKEKNKINKIFNSLMMWYDIDDNDQNELGNNLNKMIIKLEKKYKKNNVWENK